MNANNQNLTYVVNFTVVVPADLWDNVELELSFNLGEWTFYDADAISETDGIVTASIKLESASFWSNVGRAKAAYDDASESFANPSIAFGDYKAIETKSELYTIREYGI
jgi:hypothetical protein